MQFSVTLSHLQEPQTFPDTVAWAQKTRHTYNMAHIFPLSPGIQTIEKKTCFIIPEAPGERVSGPGVGVGQPSLGCLFPQPPG